LTVNGDVRLRLSRVGEKFQAALTRPLTDFIYEVEFIHHTLHASGELIRITRSEFEPCFTHNFT
jgi:hypothetical protein